jgi:hypothetical protein
MMVRERGSGDGRPWWTWCRTNVVGSRPEAEDGCRLVTSCVVRTVGMEMGKGGLSVTRLVVGDKG